MMNMLTHKEWANDILDFREAIRMNEDDIAESVGVDYDLYLRIEEGDESIPIQTYMEVFDMMEEKYSHFLPKN